MKYEDIIEEIKEGLTGDVEEDIAYLHNQMDLYKEHKLSKEILKELGRMVYDILPEDIIEEMSKAMNKDFDNWNKRIKEVEAFVHQGNFTQALETIESLVEDMEDEDDNLVMFGDDTISEYYYFRNPFEEILFKEFFKPIKEIRVMPLDLAYLYYLYGAILFEFKRFNEAEKALKKSIQINPINPMPIFELAEICKMNNNMDLFFETTKQCMKVIYEPVFLGRAYRNFGYYFIEKEMYDEAIEMYRASLFFDRVHAQATLHQLHYIEQVTGKEILSPQANRTTDEEINKIFETHKIQQGVNGDVLGLAFAVGKIMFEEQNYYGAKFCFSIVYDFTNDPEIKQIIDKLP